MKNNYECIIIVSFPRSGTHFLIDSILQNLPINPRVYYDSSHIRLLLNEEKYIPITLSQKLSNWLSAKSNIQTLYKLKKTPRPLLVKADHLLPNYYEKHEEFMSKQKIIYIYRQPINVMKSYYHYETIAYNTSFKTIGEFLHSKNRFGGEFSNLTIMECWSRHVTDWVTKENVLPISFEQMREDYHKCMENICYFLGIKAKLFNVSPPNRLPYNRTLRIAAKFISRFINLNYGITGIVGKSKKVNIELTNEDFDYIERNSKSILEQLKTSNKLNAEQC